MSKGCFAFFVKLDSVSITFAHSSLRAKRGNPYYGAASGLPRFARKDDSI